jgi:hypothetical protein
MLKNANYNLLEEITQLSQALYRFERYIKDAQEDDARCAECVQQWKALGRRHEEDLGNLMQHFEKHIERGLVQFKGPSPSLFGPDPFS